MGKQLSNWFNQVDRLMITCQINQSHIMLSCLMACKQYVIKRGLLQCRVRGVCVSVWQTGLVSLGRKTLIQNRG